MAADRDGLDSTHQETKVALERELFATVIFFMVYGQYMFHQLWQMGKH